MHTEIRLGKKHIFACFISLLFIAGTTAQEFVLSSVNDISVYVNGDTLAYPFTGGMSMPRFNNIDLNDDGIEDLIVFESLGNKFLPFLYQEVDGLYRHTYHPEYESIFPEVRRYMMVLDFNQDGIKDIATSHDIFLGEGTLRFFRGVAGATGQPQSFQEVPRRAISPDLEPLLHMHSYDIPTVGDINGDGDADLLLFPKNQTHIHYFENQSTELGYGADSLIFDLYDDCWGKVEYSISDGLSLEACPGFREEQPFDRRESCAGSYLMNYDYDQDGDKDVFFSNLFFKSLFLLYNSGNEQVAYIRTMNADFLTDLAGELPYFPGSYLLDADNDQDLDIAVVTNNFGTVLTGSSREEFFLFTNTTDDQNPDYELTNRSFIVDGTLDEGFRSSPATLDYNGDGLTDLVIAVNRDHPDYNYFSQLCLYQNNGSAEKPSFVKVQENFAGIREYLLKAAHPTFGDLDGDGDPDLIVGDNLGRLFYFENRSMGSISYDFQLNDQFFEGVNTGRYARPQIIDLDRDGLSDVVAGTQRGNMVFFKNTGTLAAPVFERVTDTLGHLYTNHYTIESAPCFFEGPDSSGLLLLNGVYTGNIELYGSIDGHLDDAFELLEPKLGGINLGSSATVHLADLNSDGAPELILGNERGGINIYGMETGQPLSSARGLVEEPPFRLYPNPAGRLLKIEMPASNHQTTLSWYSASGVRVAEYTYAPFTKRAEMDVSALSRGLYFCTIRQHQQLYTQKIVID